MKDEINIGDYILVTRTQTPEADLIKGLCAKVSQVYPDGRVLADMLYHEAFFNKVRQLTLYPGEYERVTLKPYGVTVTRTGYVEDILAIDAEQAKKIVDIFITSDEVNWSDDWPATDADVQDES